MASVIKSSIRPGERQISGDHDVEAIPRKNFQRVRDVHVFGNELHRDQAQLPALGFAQGTAGALVTGIACPLALPLAVCDACRHTGKMKLKKRFLVIQQCL